MEEMKAAVAMTVEQGEQEMVAAVAGGWLT